MLLFCIKQRLISGPGAVPGPHQVKGILSIIAKVCLLFIASNTAATSLAETLITNSVLYLRGLSTWSSCLSLWLCCQAKGKPWGVVRPRICVHRTVSAPARTWSINISLSSYLIETSPSAESPISEWAPCFVMLFPSLCSMNMNGPPRCPTPQTFPLLCKTKRKLYQS